MQEFRAVCASFVRAVDLFKDTKLLHFYGEGKSMKASANREGNAHHLALATSLA